MTSNKFCLLFWLFLFVTYLGHGQKKIQYSKKGYSIDSFIVEYGTKLSKYDDVIAFHNNICYNETTPKVYFVYKDKGAICRIRIFEISSGVATYLLDRDIKCDTLFNYIEKYRIDSMTSQLKFHRSGSHPATFSYDIITKAGRNHFSAFENQLVLYKEDKRVKFINLTIFLLKEVGIW